MNGSCYCVPEWTGDNCNQDIDECVRGIHTCDERKYEKCQNTPGGYQCTCMEGYLRGCDSCLCGGKAKKKVSISHQHTHWAYWNNSSNLFCLLVLNAILLVLCS